MNIGGMFLLGVVINVFFFTNMYIMSFDLITYYMHLMFWFRLKLSVIPPLADSTFLSLFFIYTTCCCMFAVLIQIQRQRIFLS